VGDTSDTDPRRVGYCGKMLAVMSVGKDAVRYLLWGNPVDWCGLEYEAREEAEKPAPGVDPFAGLDKNTARSIMEELWGRGER
jgi:hypothetical protein